ncbi:Planctomycete cytochrome C [Planctomycetes bacterium Pan216]|uniref:Planctomycete cytochrome C n=1 Tax=Kolteria novifilia TaxID=2527975 RepID=A0A518B4B6_9BACT|nr:Planctomycete cytochrome C [Planctomycetes bacterium Pan216]
MVLFPRGRVAIAFAVILGLTSHVLPEAGASDAIDFNRDIRPILSENCFYCHGPDANHREADLRLDQFAGATADLGGYQAIVPGDPAKSELVARIMTDDDDLLMPPVDSGKKLTKRQVDLLRRWVADGAKWSEPWAYVTPKRHPSPRTRDSRWPRNWVDRFVLGRLEKEGLSPSPEADRVTLIRRLTFDLTGLPPKPEEVDDFVNDRDPGAYERLVDRLLASPHFGERMAIYWLDLVRFADTVGYHGDQDHAITPYRDYVIEAFNANMPFDQFTREQLAGDLLPNPTLAQRVATGYNRLLQTTHEGGLQPKEYRAIYAADRVRNVSGVWLGATVGCAQCHDHKYDPYTMKDFYALSAFFADVNDEAHFRNGTNTLPARRDPEIWVFEDDENRAKLQHWEGKVKSLEAEFKRLTPPKPKNAPKNWKPEPLPAGSPTRAKLETIKGKLKTAKRVRDDLMKIGRRTMVTVATEPRTTRILPRGNWLDETGEVVLPAVPEFMGKIGDDSSSRASRLDLAYWLMSPEEGVGGLTARVFANRFWYLFFGTGIAKVLDDFGGQGEPPVQPELLDNLAIEFLESGWDVKRLVKLLVMSQAYRQGSVAPESLRSKDPYNQLVGRQSRYRLPAEMVRDNALAISGLLVDQVGGSSAKPYQPAGYYRHLNFPTRTYSHHSDQRQWRRGLYIHWQRQFLHPMLKAFDAPSREECTAQRPRSNTPVAALTLLNDPTFVEASRAFAERIVREGGSTPESRLDFAFRHAVSRSPDEYEAATLTRLLETSRKLYQDEPKDAAELVATGLTPVPNDLDQADLAAWTMVARAILNLSETITRN